MEVNSSVIPRRSPARPSAVRSELKAETSGAGAPAARESRRKLAASAGEEKRARSWERSDAEEGGIRWQAAREWRIAREPAVRGASDFPDTAMRAYSSSASLGCACMRVNASEEVRSWRRRLDRTATALGAEWSTGDEDEDEDSRRRDRILLKAGATSRLVDDMVDGGGGAGEAAVYSSGSEGDLYLPGRYLPCSAASTAAAGGGRWELFCGLQDGLSLGLIPSFLAKVIWA